MTKEIEASYLDSRKEVGQMRILAKLQANIENTTRVLQDIQECLEYIHLLCVKVYHQRSFVTAVVRLFNYQCSQ